MRIPAGGFFLRGNRMNPHEDIQAARQSVYGDPLQNHLGIAQGWAGLLQPHWEAVKNGDPLPPHVVVLLMAALKLNRMRLVHHEDNYKDAAVYLAFAERWQRDWKPPARAYHRVYVAGPYSAPTQAGEDENVRLAAKAAAAVAAKGHDVHCPHTATQAVAKVEPLTYERWMRLDFGLLRTWATALLYLAPSPGADRELAEAKRLGLTIYTSVAEVPAAGPAD